MKLHKDDQQQPFKVSSLTLIFSRIRHVIDVTKEGHFAVNGPTRKLLDIASQNLKSESNNLVMSGPSISNSSLIHLSLSKDIDAGYSKDQREKCLTPGATVSKSYELTHYWNDLLISHSFKYSVFSDSSSSIMHLFFSIIVKGGTGTTGVHSTPDQSSNMDQKKRSETLTMCFHTMREQEVVTRNILIQEEPPDPKPPARLHEQNIGVILSYLLKGEPPESNPN